MHTPMIFRDFSFISTVFIEFINIQSIFFFITYHMVRLLCQSITLKSRLVP